MKIYTKRSNAMRAAKAAGHLPADVAIVAQGDGFVFEPISGNAAAEADAKPDAVAEAMQAGPTKARAKARGHAGGKGAKAPTRRKAQQAGSTRKPPTARKTITKGRAKTKGKAGNKGDLLLSMLKRRGGASVPDLMKATGWQAQTLRARISVSARKNRWKLARERKDGVTSYRIGG
jgi:uncharacterized protein DUF3489